MRIEAISLYLSLCVLNAAHIHNHATHICQMEMRINVIQFNN